MPDLVFISPFFIVSDLRESVDFYVAKLGFEVQYITGHYLKKCVSKESGFMTPIFIFNKTQLYNNQISVSANAFPLKDFGMPPAIFLK